MQTPPHTPLTRPQVAALALALTLALAACAAPAPPPALPRALALDLLGTSASETRARVLARWPDAAHAQHPLETYAPPQPDAVAHIIVFRDVRSARVRSVVVKLSADLSDTQRAAALASSQLAPWADLRPPADPDHVWTLTDGPRRWRARWRDARGHLTVTVEAASPVTSSGS